MSLDLLNSLLKENFLDRKIILLKKAKFLGLNSDDILFLIQLLPIEHCLDELTIINSLNIDKFEYESKIKDLLRLRVIKVNKKTNKDKLEYDLSSLWEKLLFTILPNCPEKSETNEKKYLWFISKLEINSNQEFKKKVLNWLSIENSWNKIIEIVDELGKVKNKDFSLIYIENLYNKKIKEVTIIDKPDLEMKSILKYNWLEKE